MTETQRIAEQMRRAHEGESWVGPGFREMLADVTAGQAAARPVPGAHSIWELVHHIGAWDEIVRRRLEGEPWRAEPIEVDWPPVDDTSEEAWARALADFAERRRRLTETVAAFPAARLGERVPASDDSFYGNLHGVLQHDYYHAGQIGLLKRALAGRAEAE